MFIITAFDRKDKTFIIYIKSLNNSNIYLFYLTEILFLKANKTSIAILSEYADFPDIFFWDLASKLLEYIKINDHTINLIGGKQLPYKLIFSPELIKLEILKTYIETNLANGYIRSFKSPIIIPIFLLKSLIVVFTSVLINKISITYPSKINIHCL